MNQVIKTITEGKLTLEHSRFRDDFGILKDAFQIVESKADGSRGHYPFIADFKVKNFTKEENMLDATNDYTDEEYQSMLWSHRPLRSG